MEIKIESWRLHWSIARIFLPFIPTIRPSNEPASITSIISITWMCLVWVAGCRRLNDATKCQEAPRVALRKCQGYYFRAVTSAKKRQTERERKEEEDRRWVQARERRVRKSERTLSPFSYCYHQQHGEEGGDETVLLTFHSALHEDTLTLIKQPWYCRLTVLKY